MRLILDRPYRYTICVNGANEHGGVPFECSEMVGKRLLAQYAPQLREATLADLGASAPEDALSAMSLKDLQAHAGSLGVADADKLRSKAAVIDAIRQLRAKLDAEPESVQVSITTDASGGGWVQVPGPPSAISDVQPGFVFGAEGTVTVTAVDGEPDAACINLAGGPPNTTDTVAYTYVPEAQ